ncbi:ribosomal-protein-alanine N-acetyltransferase [Solemya pervernicosa gill symbiont]|uniref:[Ribosomal protein bS18]-alanine N-acetyltransferase n=2 Tax=Gammaproteobacteria incertae sedis TaxID=118884 RepID=A0A1T2L8J7_9GAMM|nr:ribosomal protein S18-alanine N-acetyltransferase [Candidatus Reidiella endopervernicosa]OOZ41415.1 ribosomal-protein-alanine N-acetyltransferase [Solemya pervernicosa gill symbiont]QKQ27547.1 ribosomal protein S18-alanine N-acetyltransferase [Candidatus Reidiella endopervernicosa]
MSAVVDNPAMGMRLMQLDDIEAVFAIEIRAHSHPWTEGILRDCLRVGYGCWVYEEAGEILGFAIFSFAAGEAHLLNLCVKPEHQGEGLGRKIINHMLTVVRRLDVDTILLEVRESNAAAIHLYDSLGFNEIGQRRNYYPAGDGKEDALVLVKVL